VGGRPTDGVGHGAAQSGQRQLVKFTFYKVDSEWRRLPPDERARARQEFIDVVESFGDRMLVRAYSLSGLRGDADFLIWLVSDNLDHFQHFATAIFSTTMGTHLSVAYSYLSMTRRSIYKTPSDSREVDGRLRVQPGAAKYLFVYPFVKTRLWYELPKDVRQQMMDDHIAIGKKYPSVKLNTTYSYGMDDQEFVVSFETDSPSDFLDLVMELRETESSSYTLRDTPTFTCVSMSLADVLLNIGAPGDIRPVDVPAVASNGGDAPAPVAKLAELPEGGSKVVHHRGEQIALFNINGRVYAVSNRCSHANGPLAEGRIEGATVTCPWHDSQFDLATGQALRTPAQRPVETYDVKIEDGAIFLVAREGAPAPH
jgi:chlorite dismutase